MFERGIPDSHGEPPCFWTMILVGDWVVLPIAYGCGCHMIFVVTNALPPVPAIHGHEV